MTMQERLIMLRKRHTWSLPELAKRSGVPHNTLYCYEQGIRHAEGMSVSVAAKLAETFGVTLDYLYGMYQDESAGDATCTAVVSEGARCPQ